MQHTGSACELDSQGAASITWGLKSSRDSSRHGWGSERMWIIFTVSASVPRLWCGTLARKQRKVNTSHHKSSLHHRGSAGDSAQIQVCQLNWIRSSGRFSKDDLRSTVVGVFYLGFKFIYLIAMTNILVKLDKPVIQNLWGNQVTSSTSVFCFSQPDLYSRCLKTLQRGGQRGQIHLCLIAGKSPALVSNRKWGCCRPIPFKTG